jgi:hypothetical protein
MHAEDILIELVTGLALYLQALLLSYNILFLSELASGTPMLSITHQRS